MKVYLMILLFLQSFFCLNGQTITDRKNKPQRSNPYIEKFETPKNQLDLLVSLPHVNSFLFKPEGEPTKGNTGFMGFSVGLDYYHNNDRYIRLSGSAVTDFSLPFPAPVDYVGEHEFMSSLYLGLTDNFKVNHFHIGYGVSFARNAWILRNFRDSSLIAPTRDPAFKASNSFGLITNVYYQFFENGLVGIVYRPTFLRISPSVDFKYEHLISIDLAFRFKMYKPKKR